MNNTKTYNWGIIGLGKIARKFADDLRLLPNARLHAVASTDLTRALDFAAEYGAAHAYGRYQDMLECPDLDVVYVATPHVWHAENTCMCLDAHIPVLCEKPFAMNAQEARDMVNRAHRNRVFLMEAMWSHFIPGVTHAFDLVANGVIGELHTVQSDFGFYVPADPQSRLFNQALGGGALLDIGIYPVMLALSLLGKPDPNAISAHMTMTATQVDESCAFVLGYPDNKMAIGHATLAANTPIEARLMGKKGHIILHNRWHHTQRLTVAKYEGRQETLKIIDLPYTGWGYHYEAAHVMDCLEEGKIESDRLPHTFTLDLAETLDMIRIKSLTFAP